MDLQLLYNGSIAAELSPTYSTLKPGAQAFYTGYPRPFIIINNKHLPISENVPRLST